MLVTWLRPSGNLRSRILSATPVPFSVDVTNLHGPDGCYSALGFVASSHKEAPRNRRLFGYDRANVPANATVELTVELTKDELSLVTDDGSMMLMPGRYNITVADVNFTLTLTGAPVVVALPPPIFDQSRSSPETIIL